MNLHDDPFLAEPVSDAIALACADRRPTLAAIEALLHQLAVDPDHQAAVAAIRPGKFRRDPADPAYRSRAAYTAALRRFIYNPALLEAIFGDAALRHLFLRSFGYAGQTDFTVYPNAWLRDFPLLELGRGCYLGDGIVLGTNQVSADQRHVMVDRITIGAGTIFDQQCMVGFGTHIGEGCTIGTRVMIGLRTRIGSGTQIRPTSGIAHHCRIGRDVQIGADVKIGSFSFIDDGVHIAAFERIPDFSHVSASGIAPRRAARQAPSLR